MRFALIFIFASILFSQTYLVRKDTVNTITGNNNIFLNRNDTIFQSTITGIGNVILGSSLSDSTQFALDSAKAYTDIRETAITNAYEQQITDSTLAMLDSIRTLRTDAKAFTSATIGDSLGRATVVFGKSQINPKLKLGEHFIHDISITKLQINSDTVNVSNDLEIEKTLNFNDTTESQVLFRGYEDRIIGSIFSYPSISTYSGFEMSNAYHNGSDWQLSQAGRPFCNFMNYTDSTFGLWVGDYQSSAGAVTGWDEKFKVSYIDGSVTSDGNLTVHGTATVAGTVTAYSDIITDDETSNTFLGISSGNLISTGTGNTYMGNLAGDYQLGGESNTAIGYRAGRKGLSQNTYIGNLAGAKVTATGSNNIGIGYKSLTSNEGDQNIFIGSFTTATQNSTGANNLVIGYNVGLNNSTDSYKMKIGNQTVINIDGDLLTGTTQTLPKYTGENYFVYMASDSLLWVASKYNATYDIVYKFERCGNNKLFTADSIDLKANTGKYPLTTVSRASARNIVRQTTTDYFPAPMSIRTDGVGTTAWVGGNHLDPTSTHRTATTEEIKIFVDDLEMQSGQKLWADNIKIRTKNVFWNPVYVATARNEILQEYLDFSLKGNTIEYSVQHTLDSAMTIYNYYGMQLYDTAEVDSICFGTNARSKEWQAMGDGLNSGALDTYTAVEKMMTKNTQADIFMQLWLDINYGLPSAISTYINTPANEYRAFTASGKAYFQLIETYSASANEILKYRGSYSFSDQSRHTDTQILASDYYILNGEPSFYADVAGTVNIEVPRQVSNMKANAWSKSNYISDINEIPSRFITITASDTGAVYISKKPSQGDLHIDGTLTAEYVKSDSLTWAKMLFNDETPVAVELDGDDTWTRFNGQNTLVMGSRGNISKTSKSIVITEAGTYSVICSASIGCDQNTALVHVGIAKNNTVNPYAQVEYSSKDAGDVHSVTIPNLPELVAGDSLYLMVKSDSGSDSLRIKHLNFILKREN